MYFTEVEALVYLLTALDHKPEDEARGIWEAYMFGLDHEVEDAGYVRYVSLEWRGVTKSIQSSRIGCI